MPKGTLSSSSYVVYTLMDKLIEECTKQGAYTIPQARQRGTPIPTDENGAHIGVASGWWYDTLGLQPTFINWSQITFIHVWMLQVRFRMFPEEHAQIYIQHLTNHVFYVAEDQLVVWHNLNSASLRQKFLKDMFAQWRAVLLSYDEALVKGDAVLAAAVWRNLLASREDVDFEKVAQIVAYMRWGLRKLESMTDEEVANDLWEFERDPGMESEAVGRQSPGMRLSDKQASA
ncbi:ubiquinol cytochrome-c reductase assembly protein Cbp3 [Polyplosphaeria fusca]|uniref:Ubiquinol cytochrome-c reductase assembly protein Cbp3 n=1 Tax=Polyplosphaeria fusca TaxID=682080 RepID=A0A9P4R3B3_9PLEO|nr:ubiquinol cytochrome-c reductase assembly protein Cbp3 [Polyplosphaeria fusca]